MTLWIAKGEFPHWDKKITQNNTWEGNILVMQTFIRQTRVIHFQNLYRYMYRYLTDEGWKHPDGTKNIERFYGESRNQEGEKQIRIWWRLKHGCGGIAGTHSYLGYKMYIDFLTEKMRRIEIVHKGKKIKPYIGDVHIWISAVLDIDINNWHTNDKLMKILKEYWVRRIYKRNIRDHEIELRRFSVRFVDDVKYFINMHRPSELRTPLHHEEKEFY